MELPVNLKWSLRALACPANIQIQLFPEFVEVADELGLIWEEVYTQELNLSSLETEVATELKKLDDFLLSIGGQSNEELWTIEALNNSIQWAQVRSLAKRALKSIGWSIDHPGENSCYQYIGSPD